MSIYTLFFFSFQMSSDWSSFNHPDPIDHPSRRQTIADTIIPKAPDALHESQQWDDPAFSDHYPSPTSWLSLLKTLAIYRLLYYYSFSHEATVEFHKLYPILKHHLYVTFVQYVYRLIRHTEREPCELDFWYYEVPKSKGSPKIGITAKSVQKFYEHFLAHKRVLLVGNVQVEVYDFHIDDYVCPTLDVNHLHSNSDVVKTAIKKWRWLEHEGIAPEWLWLLRTAVINQVSPYFSFFLDATSQFQQLHASLNLSEYRTFLRYCEMLLKHLAGEISELPFWKIVAPHYCDDIVVTGETVQLFYNSFLDNRSYLTTFDYSKQMFTGNHVYFLLQHPLASADVSQMTYQHREYKARLFWKTNLPVKDFRKVLTKTVQALYRTLRDNMC